MRKSDPETLQARIRAANEGRRPELLGLKYEAMAESAYRFFRATPTLFYQDWPIASLCKGHPVSWVCGDLHLENVGSFRADDGLVYFDMNDFEEALLAPCTVDVARLVTSVFVAAPTLELSPADARQLAHLYVEAYAKTLLTGKPRSIERETAKGLLRRFLRQVADRSPKQLLERYTRGRGRKRRLSPDGTRLLKLSEAEESHLRQWLEPVLDERGHRFQDAAFRLAGTSSLALTRYLVLVETPAKKRRLLDIKACLPSVAVPHVGVDQPKWPTEATRVATLQNRLQDVPPALLQPLAGPNGETFVLRLVQPQADRLDLSAKPVRRPGRLRKLLETMGRLTASAHLRSGGHQGSAIADELMAFADKKAWRDPLVKRAERYAHEVERDYQLFKTFRKELIHS